MKITRGIQPKAQRVVIYGTEGIGKTTLASKFPDPVFIDLEAGSNNYDVARYDFEGKGPTWADLGIALAEIYKEKPCKTLIIDTADKAEMLADDAVLIDCNKDRQTKLHSITEMPYGQGYALLGNKFKGLIATLSRIADAGIHTVVIAHSQVVKVELPDQMGQFDKYELKLNKRCAPLLKEWADMILFCNYKTQVFEGKAEGTQRVMYTEHGACWDAKNRFGLPASVPMDYEQIKHIFE